MYADGILEWGICDNCGVDLGKSGKN